MSEPAPKRLTYSEYLDADEASDEKLEYVDGQAVAMTRGTLNHATVIQNASFELRKVLEGRPCRAFAADFRLWIPLFERARFPDGMVVCGEPEYDDPEDPTALLNPSVVIEVLSPSTEGSDRGVKATEYRSLPSVQHLVFLDPRTRHAEVLSRTEDAWILRDVPADGTLELPAIGVKLPAEVFWRDLI